MQKPRRAAAISAVALGLFTGCGGLAGGAQGGLEGGREASAPDAGPADSGATVDAARALDGAACPPGESSCDGACVALPTDGENCGGCGVVCDGRCVDGRCIVTLATGACASVLAVNSTDIYWAGGATCGSVLRVPLAGGAVSTLYAGPGSVQGIALDATDAYFTAQTTASDGAGVVLRAPLGGGAVTTLASGYPWGIAVDASSVYWTDRAAGTLMKVTPK